MLRGPSCSDLACIHRLGTHSITVLQEEALRFASTRDEIRAVLEQQQLASMRSGSTRARCELQVGLLGDLDAAQSALLGSTLQFCLLFAPPSLQRLPPRLYLAHRAPHPHRLRAPLRAEATSSAPVPSQSLRTVP